jgi:hypothetical protein
MQLLKSKKPSETTKKYTTLSVKVIPPECQDSFLKWMITYESYFDKETGNPYQFVRKIDEGGYKKNQEGFFNQGNNKVLVKDYKHKSPKNAV